MRDSFIIYKSFIEAGEQISKKNDRLLFYEAIFKFALFGETSELNGISKAMFTLVKPQLEANHRRFENGKKGGKPVTKTEPKRNLDVTKTEPNNNVNVNVNKNDDGECVSPSPSSSFFSISECRSKYDTDFVPTKLALCDKHSIAHKLLVIFQNEFDKELLATGKTQKVLTDYIDHFAKWVNIKGPDGRSKILSEHYKQKEANVDFTEKYRK